MNNEDLTSDKLKIPSFRQILEIYPKLAEMYNKKTGGKLCPTQVRGNVKQLKNVVEFLGLDIDGPYTALTSKLIDYYFTTIQETKHVKAISARSHIDQCRACVAKWTRVPYEELGFKVEGFKVPPLPVAPFRYKEQPMELKNRVKQWYEVVEHKDPEVWFFTTMMLQFGMRNGDVKRLSWDNFQKEPDGIYLYYVPHKTRLTSGRSIHWPLSEATLTKIMKYKETHPKHPFVSTVSNPYAPCDGDTPSTIEHRLRIYMRRIGFKGSKCAYELRKLCACAVYKNFGQEAASSILGDDINTVLKHYADPSAVSKKVDVASLL